jgi:hypothetical protein
MPWMEGLTSQLLAERDILCALEHPHIARLYDAGLDTSGQPFIAMEYVEGAPIDEYCDRRGMSLAERVRLFLQVLEAVQYAHTRLVIHRDLKSANILINARGDAQLLDFGIAQLQPAVSPSSSLELTSEAKEIRAHTLRYASPEQLRHERLSVASDIYSLAVTLYELLTGSSPYGSAAESRESLTEAVLQGQFNLLNPGEFVHEALICRRITAKSLRRALVGELGAILQKALAMDPSRRYVSAEAFAADLCRWLELRPVLARPPSAWYSFGKFLQRNPWPVAITSVSTLVISALITVALANANRAHTEYLRATATKDFLLNIFDAANPERHEGRDITARELLVLAERSLRDGVEYQDEVKRRVLVLLADLWVRMGDIDRAKSALSAALSYPYRDETYFSAVLDLIHIYLVEGEVMLAKEMIMALQSHKGGNISENLIFEKNWYLAWLMMEEGNLGGSYALFTTLYESRAVKESDLRKLWVLYGRSVAKKQMGMRQGSNDEARAALYILKKLDLPKGEYLRRWLELTSVLLENGETLATQDDLNALAEESLKYFGENSLTYQKIVEIKSGLADEGTASQR